METPIIQGLISAYNCGIDSRNQVTPVVPAWYSKEQKRAWRMGVDSDKEGFQFLKQKHMKTKNAFTLIEIMIVIVIIGLLAAMAVPAFQTIKFNNIQKSIRSGEIVPPKDFEWYKKHPNYKSTVPSKTMVETPQTIVINGKTYTLVPQ